MNVNLKVLKIQNIVYINSQRLKLLYKLLQTLDEKFVTE